MTKKQLRARDVERLENTSFASVLLGEGAVEFGDVTAQGDTCTCDCQTCTCCLPNLEQSDFCCEITLIETLDGRCAVRPGLEETTAYIEMKGALP